MKTCERCHLQVAGDRDRCPLCQGPLSGVGSEAEEVFPALPDVRRRYHLLMRLVVFLSLAGVIVCAAVNYLWFRGSWWVLFVAAATVCLWLCLYNLLRLRRNIPKNILWMVFWLSLLAVLWDRFTGWRGWSLDYVVPCICVLAMLSMAAVAKVLRLELEDILVYLLLDVLFGVVPLVSLLLGWVGESLPSVLCVVASLLSLAFLLVFDGERMRAEIKKRLHL